MGHLMLVNPAPTHDLIRLREPIALMVEAPARLEAHQHPGGAFAVHSHGATPRRGIALDRNRMIWTWKLDLFFFHVSVSSFVIIQPFARPR
jgi:hypothetical protein